MYSELAEPSIVTTHKFCAISRLEYSRTVAGMCKQLSWGTCAGSRGVHAKSGNQKAQMNCNTATSQLHTQQGDKQAAMKQIIKAPVAVCGDICEAPPPL